MARHLDETEVDALLGGLREHSPAPSAEFLARIGADAVAAQPRPRQGLATVPAASLSGGGALALHPGGAFGPIGGWPSLGLLVLAAITGLWIGIVGPGNMGDAISGLFGSAVSVELLPGSDLFNTESN